MGSCLIPQYYFFQYRLELALIFTSKSYSVVKRSHRTVFESSAYSAKLSVMALDTLLIPWQLIRISIKLFTGLPLPFKQQLKGQSNEIFWLLFFIKMIILVSIDLPKSDFEIFRILVELFVHKLSKNHYSLSMTARSQKLSLRQPIFLTLLKCSWWAVFYMDSPFFVSLSFKGRGSPWMFLKITLLCQQWLPAIKEAGK
jgi:hypothetical protein